MDLGTGVKMASSVGQGHQCPSFLVKPYVTWREYPIMECSQCRTDEKTPPSKETDAQVEEVGHEECCSDSNTPEPGFYEGMMEKMWLFEFFALVVCVLAMLGIVIMLLVVQGHPAPNWEIRPPKTKPLRLTLNSVVSIFSTIVKSTVLIPVVASLGELKWLWFRKGQPLSDVTVYDSAAKGPLGSIMMLWAFRGRNLSCLGALIVIGSLALDFGFQQLITYPLENRAMLWPLDAASMRMFGQASCNLC
jgi:hypothetical protein